LYRSRTSARRSYALPYYGARLGKAVVAFDRDGDRNRADHELTVEIDGRAISLQASKEGHHVGRQLVGRWKRGVPNVVVYEVDVNAEDALVGYGILPVDRGVVLSDEGPTLPLLRRYLLSGRRVEPMCLERLTDCS
jgi:hypothetical protein